MDHTAADPEATVQWPPVDWPVHSVTPVHHESHQSKESCENRTGGDDHLCCVGALWSCWLLGLADGHGRAGQGHTVAVLQADVDTIDARFGEAPPQLDQALRGLGQVITEDALDL